MSNQAMLFKAVGTSFVEFDNYVLDSAFNCFNEYVSKGIILTDDFDSNKWQMTDEYSNVGFDFNINFVQYRRYFEPIFEVPEILFQDYLKSYIVLNMDQHVLNSLQGFLRDIKRLIKETKRDILDELSNIAIQHPSLCIDFISSLPYSDDYTLTKILEQFDNLLAIQNLQKSKKQRKLAQFQSYFAFNDILTDYWSTQMPKEERLFYFPLYLWWQITAIVPLRPREFLLTQRNCLNEKDGNYFLTLRRNNLKGSDKGVSHKISDDYYLTTYQIPINLAHSILEYLDLTKDFNATQLDTLFVTDAHYQRWNRSTGIRNRFLSYANLNTILKNFYNEIITQRYSYHVHHINPPTKLSEREINFIHIGDTRHIAMINLIAEGASPVTAMLLAGHDNISTSAHYFSNLGHFIECRSYQVYRKLTSSQTSYEISKSQPKYTVGKAYSQLENKGRCYSPRFANGDYSDCLKVISNHAELGACSSCPFYRKAGKDYFSMDKAYKKSIDESALIVDEAVKRVRQGKGELEDIGEALLKLSTVSQSYQEYLTAKQLQALEEADG
ncbi:TPA: site-specific integrase [Streptococcus suis]|nr:site-specific integrase [Streptococcus suis]